MFAVAFGEWVRGGPVVPSGATEGLTWPLGRTETNHHRLCRAGGQLAVAWSGATVADPGSIGREGT